MEEELIKAGYDPEQDLILARAQKRGYLPYQSGILMEDGTDIRERSRLVKALERKIDEVMIFVPPSCVQASIRIIEEHLEWEKEQKGAD